MRLIFRVFIIIILLFAFSACQKGKNEIKKAEDVTAMQDFSITSTAFQHGQMIPSKFTCDGANVSPALEWGNIPEGTKSFALICDDPDAPMGTWVHWVIYNIPVQITSLQEGVPKQDTLSEGIAQGKNDFGFNGYGGPCPPRGNPHRYFFKLYALDIQTHFEPGLSKQELLDRIQNHVIKKAELMGKYQRK